MKVLVTIFKKEEKENCLEKQQEVKVHIILKYNLFYSCIKST